MSTFADLSEGDTFRTPARTITEADVQQLVEAGGYTHPLFTDHEFAAASPFGRAPLPGQAVLLLMGGLIEQSDRFDETTIALLGFEEVRFRKPAFAGDTLDVEVLVVEKEPRGAIVFLWSARNRSGDVVCEARARMLFKTEAT